MIRIPTSPRPVFETLIEEMAQVADEDHQAPPSTIKSSLTSLDAAMIAAANEKAPAVALSSKSGARQFRGYDDDDVAEARVWSTDADVIYLELGLSDSMTREEIGVLRRKFAAHNHPDKVPSDLRSIATRRMMTANAFFDAAEVAKG